MQFRHPLVRSVAYQSASAQDRQAAHRALAEVTDPELDPDRRAWHRAQAAPEPDEDVAGELERSADRAQARGGLAAAAAFLERGVMLTPDPARRAGRALAAANTKFQAGAFDSAQDLLAVAEAGPLSEFEQARVDLLRAQLAFVTNRGGDAPLLLVKAARRLEPIDAGLARATYLDALTASTLAGRLASPAAIRWRWPAPLARRRGRWTTPRVPDLLLDGLAANFNEGYAAGVPFLRQALTAFGRGMSADEELRWLWLTTLAALHLWDDERWDMLSARYVELARKAGALSELPLALSTRSMMLLFAGDLATAATLTDEGRAVIDATGSQFAPYAAMGLAALQGRQATVSALIEVTVGDVAERGEGIAMSVAEWANAAAPQRPRPLSRGNACRPAGPLLPGVPGRALSGNRQLGRGRTRGGIGPQRDDRDSRRYLPLDRRDDQRQRHQLGARRRGAFAGAGDGRPWGRGPVPGLDHAPWPDPCPRGTRTRPSALRGMAAPAAPPRRSARATAHRPDMLEAMGMEAFAERARRELRATGETARKRTAAASDEELTAQETQIARLAREGLSNPEIGARLFLSPRTVQYHLGNVFAKLAITSRSQLVHALA